MLSSFLSKQAKIQNVQPCETTGEENIPIQEAKDHAFIEATQV